MTMKQARATLGNTQAELPRIIKAAAKVAQDAGTNIKDLLKCLDHGGLAAEMAAMELYRRTGRTLPASPKSVVLSRVNWERFLVTHNGKSIHTKHAVRSRKAIAAS
jgi:hypothetical protein